MGTDVNFYRGPEAAIPAETEDGAIYVTTDTSKMYVDVGNNRLQISGGGAAPITAVVSLPVSGWSSNAQTVSVSGVTSDNTIIVSPNTAAQEYIKCGVSCTAQAADSLTFSCTSTPAVDVTASVVILG